MFRKEFLSILGGVVLSTLLVYGMAIGQQKDFKVSLRGQVETELKMEKAVKGTDFEVAGDESMFSNVRVLKTYVYIKVSAAKGDDGKVVAHLVGRRLEVIGKMEAEVKEFDGKVVQVKGSVKEDKAISVTSVTVIK